MSGWRREESHRAFMWRFKKFCEAQDLAAAEQRMKLKQLRQEKLGC